MGDLVPYTGEVVPLGDTGGVVPYEGKVVPLVPEGKQAPTAKDYARFVAQGAGSSSDEAVAAIRSLLGDDYSEALKGEREGVHRVENELGFLGGLGVQLPGALAAGLLGAKARPLSRMLGPTADKMLPRTTGFLRRHPTAEGALTGATYGAGSGFMAGENDFTDRAESGALGAGLGTLLGPLGALAPAGVGYLRDRFAGAGDRAKQYLAKQLQRSNPDLTTADATKKIMDTLDERRKLGVPTMLADEFPEATEAVLQKPSTGGRQLNQDLRNRQFNTELDKTNPDLAKDTSQFGRVKEQIESRLGDGNYSEEEKKLVTELRKNAGEAYDKAYGTKVTSPELNKLIDHPYGQQAWQEAADLAAHDMPPRKLGTSIRDAGPEGKGLLSDYDVQHLHEMKKSLDRMLYDPNEGHAAKYLNPQTGKLNAEGRQLERYKNALNDEIKKLNIPYAEANAKYKDDLDVVKALRMGRDELFAPADKGGLNGKALREFFNSADISDAEKDALRVGAARALISKTTEGQSKKFSHNWADFINNPEIEDRLQPLFQTQSHWRAFRDAIKAESEINKKASAATGNSRTNPRAEAVKDLEGDNAEALTAVGKALVSPTFHSIKDAASVFLRNHTTMKEDKANEISRMLRSANRKDQRSAMKELNEWAAKTEETMAARKTQADTASRALAVGAADESSGEKP